MECKNRDTALIPLKKDILLVGHSNVYKDGHDGSLSLLCVNIKHGGKVAQ